MNDYAEKINELVKEKFENFTKAETAVAKARKKSRELKAVPNPRTAEELKTAAKVLEAKADLETAEKNLKVAKMVLVDGTKEIDAISNEMLEEIEKNSLLDGEKIDHNIVALLDSGILKAKDYIRLFNEAVENQNLTMVKLIAKSAKTELDNLRTLKPGDVQYPEYHSEREKLSQIVMDGREYDPVQIYSEKLATLRKVYTRTAENPAMIDKWDELTAEFLSEF